MSLKNQWRNVLKIGVLIVFICLYKFVTPVSVYHEESSGRGGGGESECITDAMFPLYEFTAQLEHINFNCPMKE